MQECKPLRVTSSQEYKVARAECIMESIDERRVIGPQGKECSVFVRWSPRMVSHIWLNHFVQFIRV